MGTAKILIVEDEPNMVAGLRDNFEYEGFQVLTALDGVEGLERTLKDSPDLVVLDVMMPRMSGLDVCKQLKVKRPSIPIIMLPHAGRKSTRSSAPNSAPMITSPSRSPSANCWLASKLFCGAHHE
jgi:DNA-binding response OmpR family regulator